MKNKHFKHFKFMSHSFKDVTVYRLGDSVGVVSKNNEIEFIHGSNDFKELEVQLLKISKQKEDRK